jgi:hypothetical protein
VGFAPTSTALRVRRLSRSSHTGTVCLAGVEPGTPRVTVSCASRYTTDTAEGVGVEPTRPCGSLAFQARPVAQSGSPSESEDRRQRTEDRHKPNTLLSSVLCLLSSGIVPGGIEPPISSVSGRRLGRSTTGLSVPRPGVEPGTPRSKRGMMSVSPPGQQRKVRESNPHGRLSAPWFSKPARRAVSGYLPFSGDGGNRTHPSLLARQSRRPWYMRPQSRPPVAEAGFEPASNGL